MKFRFNITGLDCPNCAAKLAANIEADEKITAAKINYLTEKLTVEADGEEKDVLDICRGYAKKFSHSVKIEK